MELKAREREAAASRERTVVTPNEDEGLLLVADTPRGLLGTRKVVDVPP